MGNPFVPHLTIPILKTYYVPDTMYEIFLSSQQPMIVFLLWMIKQRLREVKKLSQCRTVHEGWTQHPNVHTHDSKACMLSISSGHHSAG